MRCTRGSPQASSASHEECTVANEPPRAELSIGTLADDDPSIIVAAVASSNDQDLPIAHKGKSSKTLTITPDVKQSFFMREIKLRDVLASLEDLSKRLRDRLKGSQLPSPSRQHLDHVDDDDTTIVTFHSLEESIQKRTTLEPCS